MKRLILLVVVFVCASTVFAQNNQTTTVDDNDVPRYEIGAQFASLNSDGDNRNGFGGRFTVNINRNIALETEGNFFPGKNFDGRAVQFVAGVKAGKRFSKFGIFGKARPGAYYTSDGDFRLVETGIPNSFRGVSSGKTSLAFDVGGVLEFYPSKRIVTRFEAGDFITRSGGRTVQSVQNGVLVDVFTFPTRTNQYFQFNAGIGFRF
ncbi:MAG: hypothetical protein H7Z37_05240 [Pyrinomonadaceae bacterium]|nr:hypothetical protein [Pyrinomonadaceae bacterium]